jgi:hypothetical protein
MIKTFDDMAESAVYKRRNISTANVTSTLANDPYISGKYGGF